LEGGLERAGVPYSYGFAIILLTVMVKLATFPLTKKSVSPLRQHLRRSAAQLLCWV
jgi:YidC/Oxa1 family membrane protein insertase